MQRQYNHDRQAFLIKDGEEEFTAVPFPYPDTSHRGIVFDETNAANYSFSIYHKKEIAELDYHQVKVNTGAGGGNPQRLGWMIPLSTLTTEDPVLLAEPFLNEFVFWAYCHLLNNEAIQNGFYDEESTFGSILDKEYPDGCLLIIDNTQMPVGKTEKHYELSLASYGYFKAEAKYRNPRITLNRADDIVLTSASEIIDAHGNYISAYIDEFLARHTYKVNSFIRFFYLYQIVEVLLDKEMIELLRDFANKIENNQTTYRTADKALQKNTESDCFARVVEHARLVTDNYAALDTVCNTFLGSAAANQLVNPESIYQVRNHIVHRFRKAAADEATVKEICDYLELYLYDLLISYKLPDANRVGA